MAPWGLVQVLILISSLIGTRCVLHAAEAPQRRALAWQHAPVRCEHAPSTFQPGFFHIVTIAPLQAAGPGAAQHDKEQPSPLQWIFRLGLTRATAFVYHRVPGQPLDSVQGPCGVSVVQKLLTPNIGNDAPVVLRHIIDHWQHLPQALLLAHGHGPRAWHSLAGPFFRRARAYYRGLVGSDTRFTPMLKMPVSLSAGCNTGWPSKGSEDSPQFCCHEYLCQHAWPRTLCPLQRASSSSGGGGDATGAGGGRRCEVKPEVAAFLATSNVRVPINALVANMTGRWWASVGSMSAQREAAPGAAARHQRQLRDARGRSSGSGLQRQRPRPPLTALKWRGWLAGDSGDSGDGHREADAHAAHGGDGSHGGRRGLMNAWVDPMRAQARDTCNSTLALHPIKRTADWDFHACCTSLLVSGALVAQQDLGLYRALYDLLTQPRVPQQQWDFHLTRECWEFRLYPMWSPQQAVGLRDMATYLLADFALNEPHAGQQQVASGRASFA